jgi:hypothetical protein
MKDCWRKKLATCSHEKEVLTKTSPEDPGSLWATVLMMMVMSGYNKLN